jgi:hypothetical protein
MPKVTCDLNWSQSVRWICRSDFSNLQIALLKFADRTSQICRSHFSNLQIALSKALLTKRHFWASHFTLHFPPSGWCDPWLMKKRKNLMNRILKFSSHFSNLQIGHQGRSPRSNQSHEKRSDTETFISWSRLWFDVGNLPGCSQSVSECPQRISTRSRNSKECDRSTINISESSIRRNRELTHSFTSPSEKVTHRSSWHRCFDGIFRFNLPAKDGNISWTHPNEEMRSNLESPAKQSMQSDLHFRSSSTVRFWADKQKCVFVRRLALPTCDRNTLVMR